MSPEDDRKMKQQTLAMASGFERYGKKTRRTLFLEEMEQVVPWSKLCGLIEPVYAKAGNGRPPVGAERMLRIYFLQQWFNLSDPGVEEALYDLVRGQVKSGGGGSSSIAHAIMPEDNNLQRIFGKTSDSSYANALCLRDPRKYAQLTIAAKTAGLI